MIDEVRRSLREVQSGSVTISTQLSVEQTPVNSVTAGDGVYIIVNSLLNSNGGQSIELTIADARLFLYRMHDLLDDIEHNQRLLKRKTTCRCKWLWHCWDWLRSAKYRKECIAYKDGFDNCDDDDEGQTA